MAFLELSLNSPFSFLFCGWCYWWFGVVNTYSGWTCYIFTAWYWNTICNISRGYTNLLQPTSNSIVSSPPRPQSCTLIYLLYDCLWMRIIFTALFLWLYLQYFFTGGATWRCHEFEVTELMPPLPLTSAYGARLPFLKSGETQGSMAVTAMVTWLKVVAMPAALFYGNVGQASDGESAKGFLRPTLSPQG